MKRIFWPMMVMALLALRLPAQTSLEYFTDQANALLEPAFGFGVANIPVYSTANPAIAYSASLHYLLQSAANAYDATTPAANSPSVFRPIFSWSSNTLFIVGYTNVTEDFYTQTGLDFKALTDPTISSNDNVWGVPWVVGMKNNPPAFNEYCYSTAVLAESQLLFVRRMINGNPVTNLPPAYTNQFFFLSVSNVFGLEAWNYSQSNFPDPVTIVTSNQVSITLTNNYNWGTNYGFSCSTNWIIDSWPAGSFVVPLFTNVVGLPNSYWSESTEQFILLNSTNPFSDFLPSDQTQTGWPEHNWTLNITNNVMYGLVDNRTGQVLDFVNLGNFGSSLPITLTLAATNGYWLEWVTNGATDAPNSPMSVGVFNQIDFGEMEDPVFAQSLVGRSTVSSPVFEAPDPPTEVIVQNYSWQAFNPLVHYTVEDLGDFTAVDPIEVFISDLPPFSGLGNQISNSVCTLGKRNKYYDPGAYDDVGLGVSSRSFQMGFSGVNDLPYEVWASTNMLDWIQIGIASEAGSWIYQESIPVRPFLFTDMATTNYPARFYQIRLPW